MKISRLSKLSDAMHGHQLVRFSSRFENSTVRGYVLGIGPQFFLLSVVSDRIWFDGFECFRARDVRNLRPDPYTAFAETALRKRGERKPKKPRVSVASVQDILVSASRAFPLVTIHLEHIDPSVCYIGRVVGVDKRRASLLQIDPHARWEEKPTEYLLSQITRVGFGADYEDALNIAGKDLKSG